MSKRLLLFLIFGVGLTGCTTPGYLIDRKHDLDDVFTATVGYGLGAKARVGCIQVGLFGNSDCAGLRGGDFFAHWENSEQFGIDIVFPIPLPGEWGTFASLEGFRTEDDHDLRGKYYDAESPIPLVSFANKAYYYFQIEAAIGVGGTVRLGFNPGELIDFALGWSTVDFFGDDIQNQKEKLENQEIIRIREDPLNKALVRCGRILVPRPTKPN